LHSEGLAQIIPIQADLTSKDAVDYLIKTVESICDFPSNIVFIAAPKLVLNRFKDLKIDDFMMQIEMQLYSSIHLLVKFLPAMAKARVGKVVFVLSSYTIGTPPSSLAHYVTAKYALLGLMKSLSSEYAGKQICINAVSPSMIETSFLDQVPEKLIEISAHQHPLKRNGTPKDVAPVVSFLLSDAAGFLTGANIPVTGGA
jgi:NAD(P)-dependent dehydrogenase (short-subunit alcohol dehydrogenase family)